MNFCQRLLVMSILLIVVQGYMKKMVVLISGGAAGWDDYRFYSNLGGMYHFLRDVGMNDTQIRIVIRSDQYHKLPENPVKGMYIEHSLKDEPKPRNIWKWQMEDPRRFADLDMACSGFDDIRDMLFCNHTCDWVPKTLCKSDIADSLLIYFTGVFDNDKRNFGMIFGDGRAIHPFYFQHIIYVLKTTNRIRWTFLLIDTNNAGYLNYPNAVRHSTFEYFGLTSTSKYEDLNTPKYCGDEATVDGIQIGACLSTYFTYHLLEYLYSIPKWELLHETTCQMIQDNLKPILNPYGLEVQGYGMPEWRDLKLGRFIGDEWVW